MFIRLRLAAEALNALPLRVMTWGAPLNGGGPFFVNVQKMTHWKRGKSAFGAGLLPNRTGPSRCSTAVLLLLGIGTANAADSTRLAETAGFLLGNAHRCGVPTDRVEQRASSSWGGLIGLG
jgi:hypothetical protein